MNAILLAKGEKSKRIKEDKALIFLGKEPLIKIVIKKIYPLFKKIFLVSINPEKFTNYENKKIKIIKDDLKCGPLGAIYLGLKNSLTSYNFVFAVDMPFLNPDFIKYMLEKPKDYDILIPKYKKHIEPLHSIYHKKVIFEIENLLKLKNYKVMGIFPKFKVQYVYQQEIEKFGKPEILFFNLNTKRDLKYLLSSK